MLESKTRKGKTPFGSKQAIELSVINFVFQQLASWRDDPGRPFETNEIALTAQLCLFLAEASRQAELSFAFLHESPQGARRSTDMAATPTQHLVTYGYYNSIYNEIMVFEAKRLPAPDPTREREYVTGGRQVSGKVRTSGGIQRFKMKAHGRDHRLASLIAYIQGYDAQYFHTAINTWITEFSINTPDDLCWDEEECLRALWLEPVGTARTTSEHPRVDSAPILLHHLWVVMG